MRTMTWERFSNQLTFWVRLQRMFQDGYLTKQLISVIEENNNVDRLCT